MSTLRADSPFKRVVYGSGGIFQSNALYTSYLSEETRLTLNILCCGTFCELLLSLLFTKDIGINVINIILKRYSCLEGPRVLLVELCQR